MGVEVMERSGKARRVLLDVWGGLVTWLHLRTHRLWRTVKEVCWAGHVVPVGWTLHMPWSSQ